MSFEVQMASLTMGMLGFQLIFAQEKFWNV